MFITDEQLDFQKITNTNSHLQRVFFITSVFIIKTSIKMTMKIMMLMTMTVMVIMMMMTTTMMMMMLRNP